MFYEGLSWFAGLIKIGHEPQRTASQLASQQESSHPSYIAQLPLLPYSISPRKPPTPRSLHAPRSLHRHIHPSKRWTTLHRLQHLLIPFLNIFKRLLELLLAFLFVDLTEESVIEVIQSFFDLEEQVEVDWPDIKDSFQPNTGQVIAYATPPPPQTYL